MLSMVDYSTWQVLVAAAVAARPAPAIVQSRVSACNLLVFMNRLLRLELGGSHHRPEVRRRKPMMGCGLIGRADLDQRGLIALAGEEGQRDRHGMRESGLLRAGRQARN